MGFDKTPKPHAGWLHKQHQDQKVFLSQWAMRYFVTDEVKGRLHMSKGPRKPPTVSISLSEIAHMTKLSSEQCGGIKHAFEICFPPMRLVVAAADEDELSYWIMHLNDRAAFWREKWRIDGPVVAMTTTGTKSIESGSNEESMDTNSTAVTG